MNQNETARMIKAFRVYILELLPDMDKHSTLYLMKLFEEKYFAFKRGYEEAIK